MHTTIFYKRILKLCNEKGISITALAESVGLGGSTSSGWKTGAIPRAKTIRILADYFKVDPEYLMGIESTSTNKNRVEHKLSDQEIELLRIFNKLDIKKKTALLSKAFELEENK